MAFDLDFDPGLDVALDGDLDFLVLRDLDDISNFGKLFVIPFRVLDVKAVFG